MKFFNGACKWELRNINKSFELYETLFDKFYFYDIEERFVIIFF